METKEKGGDRKMIVFITLVIAGVVSFAVKVAAYHKKGGVADYWLDLTKRYEAAWPVVEFSGGMN